MSGSDFVPRRSTYGSTAFSAAERDGMLRVTLQAECREEIGRFVPAQGLPETAAQESQPEV